MLLGKLNVLVNNVYKSMGVCVVELQALTENFNILLAYNGITLIIRNKIVFICYNIEVNTEDKNPTSKRYIVSTCMAA